jgi:hypothetical protein
LAILGFNTPLSIAGPSSLQIPDDDPPRKLAVKNARDDLLHLGVVGHIRDPFEWRRRCRPILLDRHARSAGRRPTVMISKRLSSR